VRVGLAQGGLVLRNYGRAISNGKIGPGPKVKAFLKFGVKEGIPGTFQNSRKGLGGGSKGFPSLGALAQFPLVQGFPWIPGNPGINLLKQLARPEKPPLTGGASRPRELKPLARVGGIMEQTEAKGREKS